MPVDELMQLIENTTTQLARDIESHALDEGAYQRAFWTHWEKLPEEWSVAAANRDCERACKHLDENRILSRSVVESRTVKRDSMLAILAARAK